MPRGAHSMASATFTMERTDHLAEFDKIFDEEARAATQQCADIQRMAVIQNAPKDELTFINSIVAEVVNSGDAMEYQVRSTDNPIKVAVIEAAACQERKLR